MFSKYHPKFVKTEMHADGISSLTIGGEVWYNPGNKKCYRLTVAHFLRQIAA